MIQKINADVLNEHINSGLIIVNHHPELPIKILNYSRTAQFDKVWNEYTLACRGLVIDADYNIVARAFPKFFNIEEHAPEEIPKLPFEAFEKMDGSLGIVFHYADQWHIATRGSFVSDQALRAKEILKNYDLSNLSPHYTYLFEIIYPENRIVVDYGHYEKLVLLGVINTATGAELSYDALKSFSLIGFDVVNKYDGVHDIAAIKALNEDNKEGYILLFANGFRVKVKFEEYCRLHRIITHVSTREIWEFLRDGKDLSELIERVPDEFDVWVKKTINELNDAYQKVEYHALKAHYEITKEIGPSGTKKDFAERVLKLEHHSVIFKMYDRKPYDYIIWKMVEPEWAKPFKENLDE